LNERGPTVLLVDDEEALRRILRARLTAEGYLVHEARNGEEVLQKAPMLLPDVIVLDIGLPDIDGIEVTHRLRQLISTPIIILSVHATESDKIAALDAGADDYLTKPCDMRELRDRIRTAMRRATIQGSLIYIVGDLVVDLDSQVVKVASKPVPLTITEYQLLKILVFNAGRLMTQQRLAQEAWGKRTGEGLQMLRTTISALRQKLDTNQADPGHIATEPGVGYRLRIALTN
jgi:two-component system, OmpR family, KDP operon response regulator KdpE